MPIGSKSPPLGVDPDGKPGQVTLAALHARRPSSTTTTAIPANRHEVKADYGKPDCVRPDASKRTVTVPASWSKKMVKVTLHTGQTVTLHGSIAEEFARLFQRACEASGYTPSSMVGYVARTIGLSDGLAMHAYGIAVDVDPQQKAWGTGMSSLAAQHPAFVAVFEAAGWTLGGRWDHSGTDSDPMHFQRAGV